jgi:hypothetical protein
MRADQTGGLRVTRDTDPAYQTHGPSSERSGKEDGSETSIGVEDCAALSLIIDSFR